MHLDGARLWNVSVETGISMKELCAPFDSVSICFSKGMGAPIGSVLVGSNELIKRAIHIRKLFGGGWRQAGTMAACCLYALENNLKLLGDTHKNAKMFAAEMISLGLVLSKPCDTNMVWLSTIEIGIKASEFGSLLQEKGIFVFDVGEYELRFVFHFQQNLEGIKKTIEMVKEIVVSQRIN